MSYNGWKNYETWNIALWINNDEGLYHMAKEYDNYEDFVKALRENGVRKTPDGIAFNNSELDLDELNAMMREL